MSASVRLEGISKSFGAVRALADVSIEIEAGAIHAIVGENGAGKTTLMRVLYGALQPDSGTVEVDGKRRSFRNSADAIQAGIGMVSQHYSVIPALTCLQNLVLGAEGRALLNARAQRARAEELARSMGFSFEWGAEASTLTPASMQRLEILKLLWRKARIMVLDEPTAMLGPADADALFESMRGLANGGATVILVTHRLPEVMSYCSRVTVMRAGKKIAAMAVSDTNPEELARLIVGDERELSETAPRPSTPSTEQLEIKGLSAKGARGYEALKGIDLTVRSGEIVGVAGVDGNGQRELLQTVLGVLGVMHGSIRICGADQKGVSPADRLRRGLRIIPEDRQSEALIETWSLEENGSLGLQNLSELRKGISIDVVARKRLAGRVAERFKTKHGGLRLPIASLSGGNQQRFVAGRSLELEPKLLVAFQPARGLDLGGAADVYAAIRTECGRGMAALIISFDLDELLDHCDRIVVLNDGRLTEAPTKDRSTVGRLMVGAGTG